MKGSRDLRRDTRHPCGAAVRLYWQGPHGATCYVKGRCRDLSLTGLSVDLSDPVPTQAYVNFEIPEMAVVGTASVRYCRRRGLKYSVGLECNETWRAYLRSHLETTLAKQSD